METEKLVLYAHWIHCIGDKCPNRCIGKIAGTKCDFSGYHELTDISAENYAAFESADHPLIVEDIPF